MVWYNILSVSEHEGRFSEMRQNLLDDGWEMRGEVQSHMTSFVVKNQPSAYVTLIQDFVKEN